MQPKAQRIFVPGGVNLNRDARMIRRDQLALSKNAWPVIPGILGKRNGVQGVGRAIRVPSPTSLTNRYFPMSWALMPPINGYKYATHFHKDVYGGAGPSNFLVASSLDNETEVFPQGKVQTLNSWNTEYEPTRFVTYRNWLFAIVPGVEGFYVFAPQIVGAGVSQNYVWTKASFLFPPDTVNVQNSQLVPVTPRLGCAYKQRMVWGNFGRGMGNWLIMADSSTTTTLTLPTTYPLAAIVGTDVLSYNGRHVEVGSIEGEDLVAMQEVTLASMGSQIDSALMLLTNRTCVFVTGEILQTSFTGAEDPNGLLGTYKETRINYECGCVSADTLQKTPYGWIWASGDDVWMLEGNMPVRIGTNIRPALLACPANSRKKWSAAYADGVYMLQLVTQQTTVGIAPDTQVTGYLHEYWVLDLRDGPPRQAEEARWYGPMVMEEFDAVGPLLSERDTDGNQRIMALATADDFQTYLIDMLPRNGNGFDIFRPGVTTAPMWTGTTAYVGDLIRPSMYGGGRLSTGRIYGCIVAVSDPGVEPVWPTDSTTYAGSGGTVWADINYLDVQAARSFQQRQGGEFTADIRSRDNALDDAVFEKLLRRVDVNAAASAKVELSINAIKNQAEVSSMGSAIVGAAAPEGGVIAMPTTIAGLKSVARTFRPAETELVQARQMQASLVDSNSYVIDATNNFFNMAWWYEDNGAIAYGFDQNHTNTAAGGCVQVEIPTGTYDTINAVVSAIVSRLNHFQAEWAAAAGVTPHAGTLFNRDDPYSSEHPYFTRLIMACPAPGVVGTLKYLGPIFSATDHDMTNTVGLIIGDSPETMYAGRAKRLAALIGLDTGQTALVGHPQPVFDNTFYLGELGITDFTTWVGVLVTDTLYIDGCQLVPYKNSQRFDVASASMVIQPKLAIPFSDTDRS